MSPRIFLNNAAWATHYGQSIYDIDLLPMTTDTQLAHDLAATRRWIYKAFGIDTAEPPEPPGSLWMSLSPMK